MTFKILNRHFGDFEVWSGVCKNIYKWAVRSVTLLINILFSFQILLENINLETQAVRHKNSHVILGKMFLGVPVVD